jgi:serine/threonine protein kinase
LEGNAVLSCFFVGTILNHLARAIEAIHAQNIIHCDVKAGNLIAIKIGEHWIIQIIDFGISVSNQSDAILRGANGTIAFMSPESIVGKRDKKASYTEKTDIWSMGQTGFQIMNGNPSSEVGEDDLPVLGRVFVAGSKLGNFFKKAFVIDPVKRSSAEELAKHLDRYGTDMGQASCEGS